MRDVQRPEPLLSTVLRNDGGPLLVLPSHVLGQWTPFHYSDPFAAATDVDDSEFWRAVDTGGLIGAISVDDSYGIVLGAGEQINEALWLIHPAYTGAILIMSMLANEGYETAALNILSDRARLEWHPLIDVINIDSGGIILMHATASEHDLTNVYDEMYSLQSRPMHFATSNDAVRCLIAAGDYSARYAIVPGELGYSMPTIALCHFCRI